MKIRLDTRISSKDSKEGDQFTARVLDPSGFADGVIVGHVAKLKKSEVRRARPSCHSRSTR
jgi:hypothetical protein